MNFDYVVMFLLGTIWGASVAFFLVTLRCKLRKG